jgi:hypothetical protein
MTIDLKIKTNADLVKKRYSRIQKRFKGIIQKGILQAGFQLLDIIRTKTKKGIDFRDRPFVGFSNSQMLQRAVFNQVLGKNKREFFGFNDRTANIIRKQFNRFVAKEFRKARI